MRVNVRVLEARGLRPSDMNRSSDPYCELKIKGTTTSFRTRTVKHNVNPCWNEEFTFFPKNPAYDILRIRVYDHDTLSRDDFLGEVQIPISQYMNQGVRDEWVPLSEARGISGMIQSLTQGKLGGGTMPGTTTTPSGLYGGKWKHGQGDLHLQIFCGTGALPTAAGVGYGYPMAMPYGHPSEYSSSYSHHKTYPPATYAPMPSYVQPTPIYYPPVVPNTSYPAYGAPMPGQYGSSYAQPYSHHHHHY